MQRITPLTHPAIYTALSYLFVDGIPLPLPEEFRLSDEWDLARLEALFSKLAGPPLPSLVPHNPGDDILGSELWMLVSPEDGDLDPLYLKHPTLRGELDYANALLESCFDGENSEYWRTEQ